VSVKIDQLSYLPLRTDLAPIEAMSQDTAATLLNVARTSVQRAIEPEEKAAAKERQGEHGGAKLAGDRA